MVPFGNGSRSGGIHIPLQIADVNIGLLVILGITSIGVYGWRWRVVVEQQVFPAWRTARQRADGELRNLRWACRWWAC